MRIYTAGYGNLGFDGFIDRLRLYAITHLVDVRSVPQSSYWEDFRRQRLEQIVPATGLRYVYMGDTLGGVRDSPVLCKEPAKIDIAPLFTEPTLAIGIEKLLKAAADPTRVICLMCGCLRPHKCHRSRLVGEELVRRGVEVMHLDESGQPISQQQLAAQIQQSLF